MKKVFLSLFGLGFIRFAPGTIASVASVIILFSWQQLLPEILWLKLLLWAIIFIIIYILALVAIRREIGGEGNEKEEGYDQQWIVIDEFLGMMLVYIPFLIFDYDWNFLLLSLVLFRFFDIVKPLGIKKIDDLNTPQSVVVDDLLAGVYTIIVFYLITLFIV